MIRYLPLLLLLAGCATCRDHPTACKAGAAIVVVVTVIAVEHHQPVAIPIAGPPALHEPPTLPRGPT